MLGNPAVRNAGELVVGRIVSGVLTHEASTFFTTAVDAVYRKFKGENVTWDRFTDELIERLTDPKGVIVATVMGAVVAGADIKYGGSRGVEMTDREKSPTGEFDEIRAGVIREKKNAEGIGRINPKTGQPFPGNDAKTWAEKHIFTKTKVRINNIKQAIGTRPSERMTEDSVQAAGSRVYPSIKELQGLRKIEFKLDADTPALRLEVNAQIQRLKVEFPDWTFTASFGT